MGNKTRRVFNKDSRQIRVFISSSFEDMILERNYLRDEVFPQLQEKARLRSVAITALDLRWGIPEGTSLSETIEICMKEIDNSYPFFIGLLGKHYGTQPSKREVFDASEVLKEQFYTLERYFQDGLSITEMEMRYGILDCSQEERSLMDALFFLRASDSEKVKQHPKLNRLWGDIIECGTSYEQAALNTSNFHIWTDEYENLYELGKTINSVFDSILDRLYPEIDSKDELQIERFRQKATITELSRFHIPQQNNQDKITTFVYEKGCNLLAISGESGCGKSSTLAYWIDKNQSQMKENHVNLLYHFVGSDIGDGSLTALIKRLVSEIVQLYSLDVKIDKMNSLDAILREIPNEYPNNNAKLLIIVDAVNQLNTDEPLGWLPYRVPEGVKIIFSTTPDTSTCKNMTKDKFVENSYVLAGIKEIDIRKSIVKNYLYDFHRRNLVPEEVDSIVDWPLSINPFALRTLLDELLVVGRFNHMMKVIQDYTSVITINDLLSKILERVSSKQHYSWVADALRYVSLSLYGLSEDEILKLVDAHKLYWSSFYCSFRRHFIVRNGLLSFSHIYMREAVKQMFVDSIENKVIYHSKMVPLFEKCESIRELDEMYHQSIWAKNFGEVLYNTISRPQNFFHFWVKDSNQLIRVFSEFFNNGYNPPELAVKYEDLNLYSQDENSYYGSYGKAVLSFSRYLSLNHLFLQMYKELNRWFTDEGSAANDWIPIHKEAGCYYMERGRYRLAINAFKYGFLCGSLFGKEGRTIGYSDEKEPYFFYTGCWQDSYYRIGECYRRLGEYDMAISFLQKAEKDALDVIEDSGKVNGLADVYWALSRIYLDKGEKDKSDNYLDKCYNQTGSFETIAELYYSCGQPRRAYIQFHDELKKHRKMVCQNNVLLGKDYYWIGRSFYFGGLLEIAIRCFRRALLYFSAKEYTEIHIADAEYYLGLCFYNLKEYQNAHQHYSIASSLYKKNEVFPQWIQSERAVSIMLSYLNKRQEGKKILEDLIDSISGKNYCTSYIEEELKSILTHFR